MAMCKRLEVAFPNAAGIDVGASSHFVAVPAERTEQPVREFGCFTRELYVGEERPEVILLEDIDHRKS